MDIIYKIGARADRIFKCGVSQGRILGPLPYINDINDSLINSKVLFHVDDTVLYLTNKDEAFANQWVTEDLIFLKHCLTNNAKETKI